MLISNNGSNFNWVHRQSEWPRALYDLTLHLRVKRCWNFKRIRTRNELGNERPSITKVVQWIPNRNSVPIDGEFFLREIGTPLCERNLMARLLLNLEKYLPKRLDDSFAACCSNCFRIRRIDSRMGVLSINSGAGRFFNTIGPRSRICRSARLRSPKVRASRSRIRSSIRPREAGPSSATALFELQ